MIVERSACRMQGDFRHHTLPAARYTLHEGYTHG
jgi:hypothetical protein